MNGQSVRTAVLDRDDYRDHLALRAGVASLRSEESRTVLYFGLGVRLYRNRINIHYNANLDDEAAFEDTHRFTLSVML